MFKPAVDFISAQIITEPAFVNIFTPRMMPSAAVNIGHRDFTKKLTAKWRCGIMKQNEVKI